MNRKNARSKTFFTSSQIKGGKRMKKKILATSILIAFCIILFGQNVKAETEIKTTIQIKKDGASWTSISVSDAYDKCQELNDDNSALGTTASNVMAHLSTNADWYAVSLLTFSDYGSKSANNTTGNNSGIMKLTSWFFTSGIMEDNTATINANYQSLIDNKNTKFVEKLKTNREENKTGLGFLSTEILSTATISHYKNDYNNYPISARNYLFDFSVGSLVGSYGNMGISSGAPSGAATFRPVIWVK